MCGIAGFMGDFSPALLDRMEARLAHRGPDDSGVLWLPDARVGLAHRRLSIIDLSPLGHQPMWDETGAVVIVFNGEIYNYRELRKLLVGRGYGFKSQTDTEVILNLYLCFGEGLLPYLNGIFAFAIWDTRKQVLFLARDGLGIKPLYYTENSKGFLFASELKALLEEPSVDRTINLRAIQYHLAYLWCPSPHTMLARVFKLEPGHALTVREGRMERRWQFYDLPCDGVEVSGGETEAAGLVQESLRTAVERQMVADVAVGAFLSGGLDSSAVVAMARQFSSTNKLQCFTIGFRDDAFQRETGADDLPYAQKVAKHLDVDLHTIYVGPEMSEHLVQMIYHLDEPQADPAPINVLLICQLARSHDIKVLLSGAGGDDIFTGYRRHYALSKEKYWDWTPRWLRRGLKGLSSRLSSTHRHGRRLAKAFQYADLEGRERLASYFYWIAPEVIQGLFSADLKQTLAGVPSSGPLLEALDHLPPQTLPLDQMLYLEGKFFLTDHNLNYVDKMSMATGVEVRVPLLDPDMISLAASLPLSLKQHGAVGKYIFKRAMEPYLPPEVIYRPKTGFGAPLRHWLRHELKGLMDDLLSEEVLRRRGFFDPQAVHRLREQDRRGSIDGAYAIFGLACIELWCAIFLDRSITINPPGEVLSEF